MEYKGLTLDLFQEEAIDAIDREQSVIVTAPTGAGKTVIAEYAVEKCLQTNRRVIYTAPIKALSNQKYRDFQAEYGDKIGVVTGDVVLNPFAQVLLMTTEIFRNTIFDDIDRLQDVSYVIFDEIHYINDIERGTVWEESIIFAPQHIKFVSLSATIPNITSFAEWMQSVRDIDIKVIEELERPVPLDHHIYFNGFGIGKVDHLNDLRNVIKREKRKREKIKESNKRSAEKNKSKEANTKQTEVEKEIINVDLIPYLQKKRRLPCLYFCFSRKNCEANAKNYALYGTHNLLETEKQKQILEMFDTLCTQYDIDEESVINDFRKLIACGIAYHHAGMLPTLKEVVERLFTSGLIQLLFTTETFAVGINMPACTVVFDSLEKFDGISFRYLQAREYHQMAGRAGRRGIDPVGYVYSKVDPRYATFSDVGKAVSDKIEPITSQFNLSYSSILNLYEKYGDDIYDVYTMSLSNYQNKKRITDLNAHIEQLEKQLESFPVPVCIHDDINGLKQIEKYYRHKRKNNQKRDNIHAEISMAKSRSSRGKSKKERNKKLKFIYNKLNNLKKELNNNLCHDCYNQDECSERYQTIRKTEQNILKRKNRQIQPSEDPQSDWGRDAYSAAQRNPGIAARTYNVLPVNTLGYIEELTLLRREGNTATNIYGYELQLTQTSLSGFFERVSEDEKSECLLTA